MLIDLGDDRLTLLLRNGNRHDLVFEPALRDGSGRPPLALRREGILRLARDPVAIGDFLGRRAHLVAAKWVRHERERAVDQRRFTEAPSDLRPGQQVWLDRHVFVATRHDDLGLAGSQFLHGTVDRL